MKASLFVFVCTLFLTKGDNCTLSGLCDCFKLSEEFFEADCSERHMPYIPHFSEKVIKIDLHSVGSLTLDNTSNISRNVEDLNLSKNNIMYFDFENSFRNFSELKRLDLSSNVLALLAMDFEGKTFENQVLLEYLDLSKNSISSFPDPIFKGLRNIGTLDLSGNWLTDMDFNIGHMTNLTLIDLSSNNINFLSKKAQMRLEKLNVSESVELFLNPLSCSCESLDFLKWMLKKYNFFISPDFYSCFYKNKEQDFFTLEVIISELDKDCQERHFKIPVIYIVIGGMSFVFLLSFLGLVIFNKEWIKFKYYMFRVKHRIRQRQNGYVPLYEFDVFVSYAEEDRDFVFNTLQSELKARKLTVCNHQLDFQPGKSIVENIVYSIEHSRVTVCVVTEHFFQSKHCKMEAEWAYSRSKEEDDTLHTLFPIFLGSNIPDKFLKTSSFRYMYKTTTVFELKTSEHEQRCWDKIENLVFEHRNIS